MAAERRQKKFGPVGSQPKPDSAAEPKTYGDKVDLNDLDWEDRERVLRLLFSKINAGVNPQQNWKQNEMPATQNIQSEEQEPILSIMEKEESAP